MATIERLKNGNVIINLDAYDEALAQQRHIAAYQATPAVPDYAAALMTKAEPCPICGKKPNVETIWDTNAPLGISFRLYCNTNQLHTSYGCWQPTMAKAMKNWNNRATDEKHIQWWRQSQMDFQNY